MGSSGIKRRKPRRRLPKVQGDLPTFEMNQATNLSPAGVPRNYGMIFRAARSKNRGQRRAGVALAWFIGLPFVLIAIAAAITIALH